MKKPIEGYTGYYVSDDGKVFSDKSGEMIELKLQKDKDGYLVVGLKRDDGVKKTCRVHRLVAEAFIPNPNNYHYVNHKNEIKDDNRVENLEHCSHKYNDNYGTKSKKISEKLTGRVVPEETKKRISDTRNGKSTRQVICTTTGKRWPNPAACDRDLSEKYSVVVKICKIINEHGGNYKGRHYEYIEPEDPNQLSLEL